MSMVSLAWTFLLVLSTWTWAAGVRINDPVTIVGPLNYGTDAGGDDTYACTLDPALGGTAYVAGACYQCQVATANTGAATINFNGIGAVPITKVSGGVTTPLADNDIRPNHLLHVCFDGTQMQCQNCAGNISSASAPGFVPDGTAASLACGSATGGQMQIGPSSLLEYCGYEATPLRHLAGLPAGLTWGDTTGCLIDENQGKLTVVSGGVIQCRPDVADASTAAWNDGGVTSLGCGGGAQGQHQVLDTGRVEYCGGQDVSVPYSGYLLPAPYTWNLSPCGGDGSTCKLTLNSSNQVVVATDQVGEGGGGSGDITAVGSITGGDAGTTGFPLTSLWYSGIAAPSAPAAGQGRQFFDQTAKNLAVIADDGAIKYGAQVIAETSHFYLTSFAADGTFGAARPSSASLSDSATLVKLTDPQILTNKHLVDRRCTLPASSGAVAVNIDTCTIFERYDVGGTLNIQTPTATGLNPREHQVVIFDLLAASPQTITFSSAYDDNYTVALPTTLPAGKRVALAFRYNPNSTKYELWSAHDPRAVVSAVLFQGSTDGVITMQPQASAGTYNWNLPTSAGSSGQPLLSGGGGATAMTFGTLGVPGGGTGATTLTGLLQGNGTAAFTGVTSSTVGQVMRVTGANTFGAGALDLADADAITNDLPYANLTAASAASKLLGRGSASGAGDWQEITLGTGLSMSGTTLNAAGGGTGTVHLLPRGASLPTANSALIDASENNTRLLFDATTSWCAYWEFSLPADYAGTPVMKIQYSMTSATSGSVNFDIAVMAVTPGDAADANTESYDTANACNDAAVPGTAGHMEEISCALTNFDSGAARDLIRLRSCRNIADTATGHAEMLRGRLEFAR